MNSCEQNVDERSYYQVLIPGKRAKELYLYPLSCGHFYLEPGYHSETGFFSRYLLLQVRAGLLEVSLPKNTFLATRGSFVLVDCSLDFSYSAPMGSEILWVHFDGFQASDLCGQILSRFGSLLKPKNVAAASSNLDLICTTSSDLEKNLELLQHRCLTDLLTDFLLGCGASEKMDTAGTPSTDIRSVSQVVNAYIREHFSEKISDEELCALAGLSQYHFIRSYKKETGYTPHDYVVSIRIDHSKYLLRNSTLSAKEIATACGFSNECNFSTAFKKKTGTTPGAYRSGK